MAAIADMTWRGKKPACARLAAILSRLGRPLRFSDWAIELCLTLEGLLHLLLRQVTGMVASLPKMAKLDWPDLFAATTAFKTEALNIDDVNATGYPPEH